MRTHVTIDGITLSREQIEKAHQELNAKPNFKPGDQVRRVFHTSKKLSEERYVVANDSLTEAARNRWHTVIGPNDLVVVGLHNGAVYNGDPSSYVKA